MSNNSTVTTATATPTDLQNFVVDISATGIFNKAAILTAATALTGLTDNDILEIDFDVKAGTPTLAAPIGNPAIALSAGESTSFSGTLAEASNVVTEYIDDFELTLAAGDVVRVTGRAG